MQFTFYFVLIFRKTRKNPVFFSKISENQILKAGDIIFEAGDAGTAMYGIISGTVAMQVEGETVETIEAGDVFGEGALVHPDKRRRSTAIA